ncbi:MAG: bifunctional riboflavin kinase/FMN adenylyltransferase [Planctomycetota bacterium]|nr:bifunctional riboflavin kinase/FMN adenylyltransferase [Planctomycetota bacterium]
MERVAVTIGTFDGVHVGHRALVSAARRHADANDFDRATAPDSGTLAGIRRGRVIVLAFDPHPARVLRPEFEPPTITSFARRQALLREAGADEVVRLDPSSGVLDLSPEEFITRSLLPHRPTCVVEGPDFCFGKGRSGTIDALRALGVGHSFQVEIVPPTEVVLEDHLIARASSTLARWLIRQGRVRDAARVLGRPHRLEGVVVRGDRRGRSIGIPTANLRTSDLLPSPGVYAAWARVGDGASLRPAAVNIGTRPTLAGSDIRVEAHLITEHEFAQQPTPHAAPSLTPLNEWAPVPGQPEYGWPLTLDLVGWLRDEVRFDSLQSLRAQLTRDCRAALRSLDARSIQPSPLSNSKAAIEPPSCDASRASRPPEVCA